MYMMKNKLKITYWSVGIWLHCRTERLGLSLQSTWINQFSSRKKRKSAGAEGFDTETPFLLLKRWTKTCIGGRIDTEKDCYGARHKNIVLFSHILLPGDSNLKIFKVLTSDRECKKDLSSWRQPGELPPIIITAIFKLIISTDFIAQRYLGIARSTETRSVRQTGLKLSKYLHIC